MVKVRKSPVYTVWKQNGLEKTGGKAQLSEDSRAVGFAHCNQKDKSTFRKCQDTHTPVNIQNIGHIRRPLFSWSGN